VSVDPLTTRLVSYQASRSWCRQARRRPPSPPPRTSRLSVKNSFSLRRRCVKLPTMAPPTAAGLPFRLSESSLSYQASQGWCRRARRRPPSPPPGGQPSAPSSRSFESNPTPYSLHPAPCTLHPTPYTLHPGPYTPPHPNPETRNPKPETLNNKPTLETLNPNSAAAQDCRADLAIY